MWQWRDFENRWIFKLWQKKSMITFLTYGVCVAWILTDQLYFWWVWVPQRPSSHLMTSVVQHRYKLFSMNSRLSVYRPGAVDHRPRLSPICVTGTKSVGCHQHSFMYVCKLRYSVSCTASDDAHDRIIHGREGDSNQPMKYRSLCAIWECHIRLLSVQRGSKNKPSYYCHIFAKYWPSF